jgi:hypothetical protein
MAVTIGGRALSTAHRGDGEKRQFFCGVHPGRVTVRSTGKPQIEDITNEGRAAAK